MNHEQLEGSDYTSFKEMIVNKMKILVSIVVMFALSFCAEESMTGLGTFEWILGEWISDDGKNITKEVWEKISSKTFEGEGVTLSKADKAIINKEALRLVVMSGEIYYLAKVSHNEYPIAFKLTSFTDSTLVFENRMHDFPKIIEYKRINKNRINVMVGNEKNGFALSFIRERKK
jgi:hypothetical protein